MELQYFLIKLISMSAGCLNVALLLCYDLLDIEEWRSICC
jgi:hypothetical protein